MKFQQIQPPADLAPYVRYFWSLESTARAASSNTPTTFRTIADGCPGLIFQPTDHGVLKHPTKDELPDLFVFGQATRHVDFQLAGDFTTLGIYFQPNALKQIFGLDAFELTDSCIDLQTLAGSAGASLTARLADAASLNERVEILAGFLRARIEHNPTGDDWAVQFSLSWIDKTGGNMPLKELRDELRLSERSLERKFKQYVGISPKLFSRIRRFQSSLSKLKEAGDTKRLTDIALGQQYADQSHFIRQFKEFSGITPQQYQKQYRELVENMLQAGQNI